MSQEPFSWDPPAELFAGAWVEVITVTYTLEGTELILAYYDYAREFQYLYQVWLFFNYVSIFPGGH